MAERIVSSVSSHGLSMGVSDRAIAAVSALVLGMFLVWGAGLANSAVLHDTAHDTRHSYGFPCH